MQNEWIQVAYLGNNWSNKTVYINPNTKMLKVYKSEISHWGYHDEWELDESEEIISLEQALAIVSPDEEAMALINHYMQKPPEQPKAKWQPVYDAAQFLKTFRMANERYLQEDGYQRLLAFLSEKYHKLDVTNETNPQWQEAWNRLSITGKCEHWVGHDETISENIEMKFERISNCKEPEAWTAESDWPCEGQYQYLDESVDKGDNWNYYVMHHKGWLLKAPFGLPDMWNFEYIVKHSRS